MSRGFIELGAGTAALTYRRHGVKRPVPMQGSKDTLASQILSTMGWTAPPAWVLLIDAGEWSRTNRVLLEQQRWHDVADVLDAWAPEPERALFDYLRCTVPFEAPVARAATHLFLQSRTFRGKEVYPTPEGWKTHGFDPEYRAAVLPGAKSRGWFNARPALAARLRDLATVAWCPIRVVTADLRSCSIDPRRADADVYFDPPYAQQQGYAATLSRADVLAISAAWRVDALSEGEPILAGYHSMATPLSTRRTGTQLSRSGHEEWLMRAPVHNAAR